MRKVAISANGKLRVNVIAGTYVVLFGIDLSEADSKGIIGFAIHRVAHDNHDEGKWLAGQKVFATTKTTPGTPVRTRDFPVQGFLWQDFTAVPGKNYTYRIVALRYEGTALEEDPKLDADVAIKTEAETGSKHSVWFNRGIAGSQAYAREFGNAKPDSVGDKAIRWLSRGLQEALIAFIGRAKDTTYQLRGAYYEFNYAPVLDAFEAAQNACHDVKLIVDMREKSNGPKTSNGKAISTHKLGGIVIERTATRSAIAHNKFLVLLKSGKPIAVFTGSTNLSASGVLGHSNVGHMVADAGVAAKYLDYWNALASDPTNEELKPIVEALSPITASAVAPRTQCIFSPRASVAALSGYRDLARAASGPLFFTSAFGIGAEMEPVFASPRTAPIYVLMDSKGNNASTVARTDELLKVHSNQIAIGGGLPFDRDNGYAMWLSEVQRGVYTRNVGFVHDKFLLIDPLSLHPIVVTGSANFSKASTVTNDENMLVIRDDLRVADIYLGEFIRLWRHYYFRDVLRRLGTTGAKKSYLLPDDTWRNPYFDPTSRKRFEREVFGKGVAV